MRRGRGVAHPAADLRARDSGGGEAEGRRRLITRLLGAVLTSRWSRRGVGRGSRSCGAGTSPRRSKEPERPCAAWSPMRPPVVVVAPWCMRPRRKVPVVTTTRGARSVRPSRSATPLTVVVATAPEARRGVDLPRLALDEVAVGGGLEALLHPLRVLGLVALRARAPWRGSLGALEHAGTGSPVASVASPVSPPRARRPRVASWPLASAADRGIAAHLADGVEVAAHQGGAHAQAGGRCRGLDAGMAATDHHHLRTRPDA